MQSPQHVYRTRSWHSRIPDSALLDQWVLASAAIELAPCGLEWKEVRWPIQKKHNKWIYVVGAALRKSYIRSDSRELT